MPGALTRKVESERSGGHRLTQIGDSGSFKVGRVRRFAWPVATALLAILFLPLSAGQQACAQTFTVIHSFNGTNGLGPWGLIMDAAGNLYGTTNEGGSSGRGTVFKIDPSGNETILHNFTGGIDGAWPLAGLAMDSSGNLYGTTEQDGGPAASGTVFKIDTSGNETILHSFTGSYNGEGDGANPHAGVILDVSGNLYGTTNQGGSADRGTVFKIDPSGNETILHNFAGGADGQWPNAGLMLDASGSLYGTTEGGGTGGYGTVFKIDSSGNEIVLHNFTGGTDGASPEASLIMDSSGNLYGTTQGGGIGGYGTAFKIDSFGNKTVLHNFTGGTDGISPLAGLIMDATGSLYGTTMLGGDPADFGSGTVFKIDSSGNETVLHVFTGGSDGRWPESSLVLDSSGNLYGTTKLGGDEGNGAVFKIVLTTPFSSFSAKLNTTAGDPPGFQLQAFFMLGTGSQALVPQATFAEVIDPVAQGMTLSVGTYDVTIPPRTFHQTKKGWWVYEGMIGGVTLDVRISQTGVNPYELQFEASGLDLTSLSNPVTVALSFGNNTGTTQVNQ